MGGKVWTVKEERIFWTSIIPNSPKRIGIDKVMRTEKSWAQLVHQMEHMMGSDARRTYTALMLFEHYFQNAICRRFSPNATSFISEYLRKAESLGEPIEPLSERRRGPYRARRSRANSSQSHGSSVLNHPSALVSPLEQSSSTTDAQSTDTFFGILTDNTTGTSATVPN